MSHIGSTRFCGVSSLCTNFLPQDMTVFSLSLALHSSIKTGRSGCKLESVAPCYSHYYPIRCNTGLPFFCAQSTSRFGHGLTPAASGCALCHCTSGCAVTMCTAQCQQMVLSVAWRLACSFTSMGYIGLPCFFIVFVVPNIWKETFVALFVSVKHYFF